MWHDGDRLLRHHARSRDATEAFWNAKSGGLRIEVCTPTCEEGAARSLANFDLYVYESNEAADRGALLASSARPLSNEDELVAIPFASGYYLVQVVYAQMLEPSGYRGVATFARGSFLGAQSLGLQCRAGVSKDDPPIAFQSCSGFVPSVDGHPLFADISIPDGATRPLPTLVMLHAFAGNGGLWRSETAEGCWLFDDEEATCFPPLYRYNRRWT